MIKFKSAAAVLITLPVGLTFCTGAYAETANENRDDIVILYTNDVHCGVDMNIGYDGVALYRREMEALHDNVFLVDAGDAIQGMALGTLSKGADVVEIINSVGYSCMTLGNHEFDYTVPELLKRSDELACDYLCCNFFDIRTAEPLFKPYEIFDMGEKQIAFVGVTTPETFSSSTPTYFMDDDGNYIYTFSENGDELYDVVQASVDSARDEGADYVIIVGHLGEAENGTDWLAMDVVEHTNGVDALIDGHSHQETPCLMTKNKDGKEIPITQTGTKLANLGKMTISEDGAVKTELISTVPAPTDDMDIAPGSYVLREDGRYGDAQVNDVIYDVISKFNVRLEEVIGYSDFPLCDSDPQTGERRVRNGETNLGDFICDSLRTKYGTDIAIFNGGGIRAGIDAGEITYGDCMAVLPFQNSICCSVITGQQLLDLLELASMVYPEESGYFLHVSGMEYTIDESVPSSVELDEHLNFLGVNGEYRVRDVKINGQPIDLNKTYTVTSNSYILEDGGDGFIISGKTEPYLDQDDIDLDSFLDYIKNDLGGVVPAQYSDPYGSGRIKIVNGAEKAANTDSDEAPAKSSDTDKSTVKSPATDDRTDDCGAAAAAFELLLAAAAAWSRRKINS